MIQFRISKHWVSPMQHFPSDFRPFHSVSLSTSDRQCCNIPRTSYRSLRRPPTAATETAEWPRFLSWGYVAWLMGIFIGAGSASEAAWTFAESRSCGRFLLRFVDVELEGAAEIVGRGLWYVARVDIFGGDLTCTFGEVYDVGASNRGRSVVLGEPELEPDGIFPSCFGFNFASTDLSALRREDRGFLVHTRKPVGDLSPFSNSVGNGKC